MGQTLHIISDLLPGRNISIEEVKYPTCSRAWEIAVDLDGKTVCVLALGLYTDAIIKHLGGDPRKNTALGIGYGLERMAAIHFGYDDIRKLPSAKV
jgi:phenylalanyl-tRNA synthetase alpha subunit